jgi:SAM-dependent methyltransferase
MDGIDDPYYRRDLALVHHRGYAFHADACAPEIAALLAPVRARDGLVVELGCGSGLLTRRLLDAGHRVLATDASPAMLELARQLTPDAEDVHLITLPDDPIPPADAVVGVGHALNYLPDEAAVDRALVAIAEALRPGGVLAIDLCDLEWAEARRDWSSQGRAGDDWAIITQYSVPSANRFVREMTTFVRNDDGSWRRDDERHDNVLIDTTTRPCAPGDARSRSARGGVVRLRGAPDRASCAHRPPPGLGHASFVNGNVETRRSGSTY